MEIGCFYLRRPAGAKADGTVMAGEPQDLGSVLNDLAGLRARADDAFDSVAASHPEEVACRPGCDDCCHALFDLSPVEALSIARAFAGLPRRLRREIARAGAKASGAFDRAAAAALAARGDERLRILSRARVACPLLKDGRCLLYAVRPLTCRLYGVPAAIEGVPRTCRLARFRSGQSYPTVDLGAVQAELDQLSRRACRLLPSLEPRRLDLGRVIGLAEELAGE